MPLFISNLFSFDFLAFKSLTSLTLQYLDVSPLKVSNLDLDLDYKLSNVSDLLTGPAEVNGDLPESKPLWACLPLPTAPL